MAIRDFKHFSLNDPEAQKRALGNIEREYQTRVSHDSEEAGAKYLQTLGLAPSDADLQTAREKRDCGHFQELRAANPFEAAALGQVRPDLYAHAPETKNDELRGAQARAIGSRVDADAARAVATTAPPATAPRGAA